MNNEPSGPEMEMGNPEDSAYALYSWRILAAAHRAGAGAIPDLASNLTDRVLAEQTLRMLFEGEHGPLAGFGDAQALLTRGCGIEVLRAMKARAKRDLGLEQSDPTARRVGMLAFGLVLAAMLVQHRTLGTRAPREAVEELLLAMCGAEVAWVAALSSDALFRLGEMTDGGTATRAS
jgi:hypothetical protein